MRERDLLSFKDHTNLIALEDVLISNNGKDFELLKEGKRIRGRFGHNIRIDHATHGTGQTHAHVYGRNNKQEIGVVNADGSGSHGTIVKLHKKDADELRKSGINVRPDSIVEWIMLPDQPQFLFG